ncbi:MAG: histidine phosphatase family protein [Clostridia bacterium]|nr:histidine phosphatase family protein [Clostridia bacterium]
MKVYLVRHGESRQNVDDTENHPYRPEVEPYENWTYNDWSLTKHGERQADLVGRRLASVDFDAIMCGPLHRQIATAYGIIRHQKRCKKLEIINDLLEKGIHSYAGMPIELLRSFFPDMEIVPCPNPTPTGGKFTYSLEEMYDMVEMRERGRRIEKYLTERFPDNATVLLVSSGDFMGRSLIPCLMRLPDQVIDICTTFSCHNASLSRIDLASDGRRSSCKLLNDTAHLYVPEEDIPLLQNS